MKNSLFRTLFWSLTWALAYFPTHTSQGCIWDPAMDYPGYHLFYPEVANLPGYRPFYFSFHTFYGTDPYAWETGNVALREANLDDWMGHLRRSVPRELLDSLIYTFDTDRMTAEARKAGVSADIIAYLAYAKRCEPQVNLVIDYWDETAPRPDSLLRTKLVDEGVQAARNASNPFLKLRYAFQAVRLAHYNEAYKTCVQLYDNLIAPLRSNSPVAGWAMGHKAGALAALGKKAEANYLFIKAFLSTPSKRKEMFSSIQIADGADFQAVLMQCQNAQERSAAYFIRAIDPQSRALEEMQSIYSADPGSELLSVLLAREVCKFENDLPWGVYWGWEEKAPLDTLSWRMAVKSLQEFTRKAVGEGKVHNPDFWRLSGAWLAAINNQPDVAMTGLTELISRKPAEPILKQALMMRFFVRLNQVRSLTNVQEDRLFEEFKGLSFPNDSVRTTATREMERVLANIYLKQNDLARAYMCQHEFYDLLRTDHLPLGEAMVGWLSSPARSGIDRYLRAKITEEGNPLPLVQEWHGTALFRHGRLADAKAVFEKLPADFRQSYALFSIHGDPFALTAADCIVCEPTGAAKWNKLSLVTEMLRLESQHTAPALFALGNAWYYISYFGPGWYALDYFRSGGNYPWPSMEENAWRITLPAFDPAKLSEWVDFEVQNLNTALGYLKQAQAASGNDKELQAKIAFALAKCTQKQFYQDAITYRNTHEQMLKLLTKEYGKTAFVRGMMKECSYLNLYAKTGNLVELDR